MYDDNRNGKKAAVSYRLNSTSDEGAERPASDGRKNTVCRRFTVNCRYKRIEWVSTVKFDAKPRWRTSRAQV